MTASAVVRRSSRSGENSRASAISSATGSSASWSVDRDRRRLLLEQARPRARAGQRLLGEDPLLGLGEQVRAVAPRGAQVVAAEVQPVGGEQRLGALVVERRPLELEEDQRGLDLRAALLHALQQRAALGVGGGRREVQHRVGAGAADQLLQRRELRASRRRARARRARRPCRRAPSANASARRCASSSSASTPAAPSSSGSRSQATPSTSGSATSFAAMAGETTTRAARRASA